MNAYRKELKDMENSLKNLCEHWEKRALDNAYKIGYMEGILEQIYEIAEKNDYENIIRILERYEEVK